MENEEQINLYFEDFTDDSLGKRTSATETQSPITNQSFELRAKIRSYTKLHRGYLRANLMDSLRLGIGEIDTRKLDMNNLTENDVSALARRIKRRKHATDDDMYRLSNAFLMDEKNIETFSKITGAMQVLVKELTGKDSERRLRSAECLCNLSLGQAPTCDKISLLAGSYFITYLHSIDNHLIRICLWNIANILATSSKSALNLMKMQLFPKLWSLYACDSVADEITDFREEAAVCIQTIALSSKLLLMTNEREFVKQRMTEKNPTCSAGEYHLQIIFYILFSENQLVFRLSHDQQLYLVNYSLSNICNTKEFETSSQRLRIVYSIRILGNLIDCHSECYSILLHQISLIWQTTLFSIFNTLFAFRDPYLTCEVLWFLNNILYLENFNATCVSQISFLEKLKIPKGDYFSIKSTE